MNTADAGTPRTRSGQAMGNNLWTRQTPCPREFDCRMCGDHVLVTERDDRRTVFCRQACERRYWRHADRYERRKDISAGHVVRITAYGETGWRQ